MLETLNYNQIFQIWVVKNEICQHAFNKEQVSKILLLLLDVSSLSQKIVINGYLNNVHYEILMLYGDSNWSWTQSKVFKNTLNKHPQTMHSGISKIVTLPNFETHCVF